MIDQSSFTIDNCNRVINTFSPSCRLSREILLVLTPASGKNAVFSFVRLLLVVLVMLRSRGGTSYDNCYVTTMIPPSLKYTIWLFVQMSPIASLRFMMSNKERSPCSFFDDQRQPSKKVLRHPCCHDRFIYGKSINPIASKLTKSESFVMWESEGDPSDIFAIQSLMDPLSENAKECLRIVTIRF